MSNSQDFILNNAIEVGKDTKVTLGTITSGTVDLSTGNYFAETLAGNTTYVFSNPSAVQSFQLEVTGGIGSGYALGDATYDGVSFSVSGQESNVRDIEFKPDGTKFYITGGGVDTVFQYSCSTPFDISTASYDSVGFSVVSEETNPTGIAFKTDGTKMYICGSTGDDVNEYNLSTPWDVSTASFVTNFSVSAQAPNPNGVEFKPDGTKMYVVESGAIEQYSLSTAWDLSTASYDSVSFSFSNQDTASRKVYFDASGTTMLMVGATGNNVYSYTLSTAWDVSTAWYDGVSFSIATETTVPYGLSFSDDGTKMFISSDTGGNIYQYSTYSKSTITWPASVQWPAGITPILPEAGETDLYTFVTDDSGTTYIGLHTADNLS